jgi:glucose/arabinose dehydrogenase
MKKRLVICVLLLSFIFSIGKACETLNSESNKIKYFIDTTGLTLPKGFVSSIVANGVGRARHIAVAPNGSLYVKSGNLFKGKGIIFLKPSSTNDKLIIENSFGNYGGTGIAIKNGYLYASSDEEVFRYKLNDKYEIINPDTPEKIITGLINRRQHESKSIALDNAGNIYVNIGAYANSCQQKDRTLNSPGIMPCPILDSAGGIWMFKADKLNQTYGDGIRYATGLRNVVGLDWNSQTNSLFVMQHGRDQLFQNWPAYYDEKSSAELPSECMYELTKGSNAGWPYIYYDHIQKKKILAPEYGGDGKKEGGKDAIDPAIAFPGHLAPNGLLFYTGTQFPEKYRNGAFIAFHGSWNRAPLPQKGYFVVFVPFKNGKPTGDWEIFADGFSGKAEITSTRQADHRPCGLTMGPDGSLYVSDDSKGTIYKISYQQ